jgi:trk system potassium uptake protein TrkA
VLNFTVGEFNQKKANEMFRILAYTRNNDTFFPEPETQLLEGDQVYVITTQAGCDELTGYFGNDNINIKNIMILGGSRIGRNAAKQLGKKFNVKLIEQDRSKSYRLSNDLKGTLVINGDGRNVDLLMEEGLPHMDAFVAVTGDSETNMLSCLLAKRLGVKRTIAEIENTDYIKLAENMGIDNILNKKLITAGKIHRFTVSDDLSAVKYLTGTDAEVMEFIAKPDSRITQGSLNEINFPVKAVIGGIVRGRNVIIPNDIIQIRPFDRVVVFALPDAVNKLAKFFTSNDRFF